jgi:hypothetical protein
MSQASDEAWTGVIQGDPQRPIGLERWAAAIVTDDRLRPPDPVEGIDPFTREPLTFRPHPGTAYVVEQGVPVGMMTWAEDDSDEILVSGSAPIVRTVAEEIAERLSGRFVPDTEPPA